VTGSVVASRDLVAVGCRVEARPHGERPECRAEHLAELPGEEPFEEKAVHYVQEARTADANAATLGSLLADRLPRLMNSQHESMSVSAGRCHSLRRCRRSHLRSRSESVG
jgi:hypothetical protein